MERSSSSREKYCKLKYCEDRSKARSWITPAMIQLKQQHELWQSLAEASLNYPKRFIKFPILHLSSPPLCRLTQKDGIDRLKRAPLTIHRTKFVRQVPANAGMYFAAQLLEGQTDQNWQQHYNPQNS